MTTVTEIEKKRVIAAYKKTKSTLRVQELTGRSLPTVTKILKQAGVMKECPNITPNEVEVAKQLLAEGHSLRYVRKQTRYGVVGHLIDSGAYKRGQTMFNYEKLDWNSIKVDYLKGVSLLKLQKKYGGSYEGFVPNFKKRFPGLCMLPTEQRAYAADLKWQQLLNYDVDKIKVKKYRREVRNVSNVVFNKWKHVVDPKNLRSKGYHLDHMLSVRDASFRYTKPLRIRLVSHPANFEMLTGLQNRSKNSKSTLTLTQLKRRIRLFEDKYGPVF